MQPLGSHTVVEARRSPAKASIPAAPGLTSSAGLVDLDTAIYPQIAGLGEHYWGWVHRPSTRPHFRHFKHDIIEFFSATPWWAIPIVWIPVIALLTRSAMGDALLPFLEENLGTAPAPAPGLSPLMTAAIVALGVLVWTFLEYGLHRFLFHMPVNGSTTFLIKAHWVLHGQHHKFPLDKGRLVFPPVAGFGLALPFYVLFHALLSRAAADALMAGALLGYMGYDLTHYYLHHGRPQPTSYFGRLKAYHRDHHYKDPDHGERAGCGRSRIWVFVPLLTRNVCSPIPFS
jgi:sterol desaturase/sphingolipid hydroxylase (fatty acid hydroxylase superfamily)